MTLPQNGTRMNNPLSLSYMVPHTLLSTFRKIYKYFGCNMTHGWVASLHSNFTYVSIIKCKKVSHILNKSERKTEQVFWKLLKCGKHIDELIKRDRTTDVVRIFT